MLKIAFLGSRGIPRCYSGFETAVEEVSVRLVRMGHEVTVYNRIPYNTYSRSDFQGVRIVRIPTIQAKGTDTLVHSALCTLHALVDGFDIVYYCGVGSSIFSIPAKLGRAKTVVNVDGADWERAKWGMLGKNWLRWSEWMAAKTADSVIADHPIILDRYRRQFGIECNLISYGAEVIDSDPGQEALKKFSLPPKGYFLFVSRLTPENGADLVMEAFLKSQVDIPLVVIGDAPYLSSYQAKLKSLVAESNGRILMTGYQFGDAYRQLSFHARAFVYPTTIEATRPVLLEQMGMGSCVLARDTPANRHILADAAVWFSSDDPLSSLAARMKHVADPSHDSVRQSALARQRIRDHYSWDRVAGQYQDLFVKLCARESKTAP
jgi:glycosyltransferase involved in cell wall biosynthesis